MSKTNYLQAVISDLQRTAGPYRSAKNRHPDPRKPKRLASLASQERLEPSQNEPTGID